MKIGNIRMGLATNSSSSHYIVFLPPDHKCTDEDVGTQEFGWNEFFAVSREAKLGYLAQIICGNLAPEIGYEQAAIIAEKWCEGIDVKEGYIDHQSFLSLPCGFSDTSFGKPTISKEFFEDLKQHVLQNNVAILGGNDNAGNSHEAHYLYNVKPWYGNDGRFSVNEICRKDPSTGVWTIFNKSTGNRVSMYFGSDDIDMLPSVPLLVDLKITDWCNYGCSYCYQNSNQEGKHADYDNISSVIYALQKLQVFEVAIGGGDPTKHPEFETILRAFESAGIVPNFSTKNKQFIFNWLENPQTKYGAVAYSAGGNDELRIFMRELTERKLLDKFTKRGTIHHVVGTSYSIRDLFETVKFYNVPLILLGYKNVGRGKQCKTSNVDWLKEYKEVFGSSYSRVGIDTHLAKIYEAELIASKVSKKTYSVKESDSSLYIDAVNGTIGPSSYANKNKMKKINLTEDYSDIASSIDKYFKKFRVEANIEEESVCSAGSMEMFPRGYY